jgi:thiamine biosynthesis protein ThiS
MDVLRRAAAEACERPTLVQIHVNGQTRELPDGATVLELLEQLDLKPRRVAVERNKKIVRRASFAEAQLGEGDRVEIVTLVGGG